VPIIEVRTYPVRARLRMPFVTALRTATAIDTLVVEVVDEDGRRGFGEAPQVWRVTGASVAGARACVAEMLAPVAVGRDADDLVTNCHDIQAAVVGNEAAKAAVDVALHDLAARRLGVPLVRLLGGTRLRIPTDVTLSAASALAGSAGATGPDLATEPGGATRKLVDTAKRRVDDGFAVLKIKVGTDAASDAARVRAVREAVGPDVTLRLDANQGWTPRQSVRILSELEAAGVEVELVEQPVPGWDLDGLSWVSDRVNTPILADESVYSPRDLVEVIRRRAADMVNVKLAKCGGISSARTLLSLAEEYGMGTVVGSMMEGPVGVGAAASLVAAYGTTAVSDLDAAWWLAESPVTGGISYADGYVELADAPGLGIDGLAGHAGQDGLAGYAGSDGQRGKDGP
jgi:L-Ala-D/L-Glu epimerase